MENNTSSEFYYNHGITEFEEGNYTCAIENFKKAIEIDSSVFDYHYNLGVAYLNIKEYDLAIEAFKEGIPLKSKDSDLYVNLGLAFYSKGDYEKAAKAYKKAVWINSGEPEHSNYAGLALCALGNYKEAINHFKHAVKIEPKDENYNYNLAYAFYGAEKYDLAEEQLVSLATYNRQNEEAFFLMGKIYVKQYDYELARDNFEKVLALNPDHTEAQEAIKEIDERNARKAENKAKNKPKGKNITISEDADPEEILETGMSYYSNNDFTSAIDYLKGALAIYPGNEKIKKLLDSSISKNKELKNSYNTLANKYIEQEEYELALDNFVNVLKLEPKNKAVQETMFHIINAIYINKQDYPNAQKALKKILDAVPDNPEAEALLAQVT